ncbi:SMP-30/gluconolactonase/LRE family protein [Mameliella alba]|nr:SMP-30/gluconolactonase/LRE family protein [Antarctobacter heliothermus]MBY6145803.1 SMP-30/gluconolactonase/LRE family protein [Mameliella alba]MCA0954780.1 SMP-30/gluconolactonase/LRE family protein [Mameliella alba]
MSHPMPQIRIACPHRTVVGESPVYDPRTGALHWVDILGKAILTLRDDALTVTAAPDFPTAIGLCRDKGTAIVAFAGSVSLWQIGTDRFTPFARIEDEPDGNRLNEGAVAPDGSFWVGTMQSNFDASGTMRDMDRNSGAFHRVAPDGSVTRLTDHRFGITNTLVWDKPRGHVIFADTLAQALYRAPWPNNGPLAVTPFAVTQQDGFPDGSCIDAEGHVWNARYAGGCLLRFAPDGSLDRRVPLPATNITACAFGGEGLRTLYVTTATNQLDASALSRPEQGALLALDVGVAGCPSPLFGA